MKYLYFLLAGVLLFVSITKFHFHWFWALCFSLLVSGVILISAHLFNEYGLKRWLWWALWQLKSKNLKTRWKAAIRLADLRRDKRATEPLIKALKGTDSYMRERAAWALGRVADKRALKPLVQALEDKNHQVRYWAVWALGEIRDQQVLQPLVSALADKDDEVRRIAYDTLEKINPKWRQSEQVKAVAPSPDAKKDLVKQLRRIQPVSGWFYYLEGLLQQVEVTQVVEALLELLVDKDWEIREEAKKTLERINPNWRKSKEAKAAISSFADTLKVDDPVQRRVAATILGEIGDTRVMEPLLTALRDEDGDTVILAARSLEKIDPNWRESKVAKSAVTSFCRALQGGDVFAARALGVIREKRALEPLMAALSNRKTRIEAAKALLEINDQRALEPFRAAFADTILNKQKEEDQLILGNVLFKIRTREEPHAKQIDYLGTLAREEINMQRKVSLPSYELGQYLHGLDQYEEAIWAFCESLRINVWPGTSIDFAPDARDAYNGLMGALKNSGFEEEIINKFKQEFEQTLSQQKYVQ